MMKNIDCAYVGQARERVEVVWNGTNNARHGIPSEHTHIHIKIMHYAISHHNIQLIIDSIMRYHITLSNY